MTLKECYQLLGVESSTTLEDVKRAYRRRAFELHPDLNPHLADANRQFQQLNEAYVILSRLIAAREARDERQKSKFSFRKAAEPKPEEREPEPENSSARKSAQDSQKAQSTAETGPSASSASQSARQTTAEKTTKKTADTQEKAPGGQDTTQDKAQDKPQDTSQEASQDKPTGGSADSSSATADGRRSETGRPGRPASDNLYTEQQEVLRDILNDPFARRVFEDIYSEIRKKGAPAPEPPRKVTPPKSTKSFTDMLNLSWGQRKSNVDFSHGVGGAVKGWLRNQIDEEQTFHLPAAKLFPGARVRLQIRHGLSDNVTTLEVTLPPDFAVGKPIRLKGMGKKLGRWQGDLYLLLVAGS